MVITFTHLNNFRAIFQEMSDIFGFACGYRFIPLQTEKLKDPPPFNLTIYKGQKNVILSRTFVDFVLDHEVALAFLRWCEDMLIPDEAFYSTLIRIKNVKQISDSPINVFSDPIQDIQQK